MKEQLAKIRSEALAAFGQAQSAAELDSLRVQYLGKKGELTAVLKMMGKLSAEERPAMGQLANEVRSALEAAIEAASGKLEAQALEQRLKDEAVDVVIRPEDIDIVPMEQGQLVGTVTSVTFKGMQYDIIVDFRGFKWLIQTTDHSPVGARIGIKIDPDGIHIMKKSQYSGMFGDYSSFSEEYEEMSDANWEADEEESEDEK